MQISYIIILTVKILILHKSECINNYLQHLNNTKYPKNLINEVKKICFVPRLDYFYLYIARVLILLTLKYCHYSLYLIKDSFFFLKPQAISSFVFLQQNLDILSGSFDIVCFFLLLLNIHVPFGYALYVAY